MVLRISGSLPDGLTRRLTSTDGTPETSRLIIEGIPAETGTFSIHVKAWDAYFAVAEADIEITVNP